MERELVRFHTRGDYTLRVAAERDVFGKQLCPHVGQQAVQ